MGDRGRGYLWAELGALGGAVVAGIPAAIAWGVAIAPLIFEADGSYLVLVSGLALGVVALGGTLGCRLALRRKGLPDAGRTAMVLAVLLAFLYFVGLWSSDTSLQSDLLPYLAAAAPFTPLLARGLVESFGR